MTRKVIRLTLSFVGAKLSQNEVDGSTVSPPSVPRVTASIWLLDAPQGSGISPDDPIQIIIDAPPAAPFWHSLKKVYRNELTCLGERGSGMMPKNWIEE